MNLGVTASEMKTLREAGLLDEVNSIFNRGKFLEIKGKVMVRLDNYQGMEKVDYSLVQFQPKITRECLQAGLKEIQQYLLMENNLRNIN